MRRWAPAPRRYVLALLMIAYTLSFLDRQVLSILVEPIKNELHVCDAPIGLLTGPVFVIFYTFLGIPIAWLADRRSRPVIITVCLTLWSAFTALSGLRQQLRAAGAGPARRRLRRGGLQSRRPTR